MEEGARLGIIPDPFGESVQHWLDDYSVSSAIQHYERPLTSFSMIINPRSNINGCNGRIPSLLQNGFTLLIPLLGMDRLNQYQRKSGSGRNVVVTYSDMFNRDWVTNE